MLLASLYEMEPFMLTSLSSVKNKSTNSLFHSNNGTRACLGFAVPLLQYQFCVSMRMSDRDTTDRPVKVASCDKSLV